MQIIINNKKNSRINSFDLIIQYNGHARAIHLYETPNSNEQKEFTNFFSKK